MSISLQKRISNQIQKILNRDAAAWLVWCDPQDYWASLLRSAAGSSNGFKLVELEERTNGEFGGPVVRRDVQKRLDAGEKFVLRVKTSAEDLGWLWAQALLAEQIYSKTLREQLREWGWRPANLTTTDQEIKEKAIQNMLLDPAEWSNDGLQPKAGQLHQALAFGNLPDEDSRMVLDLTIEQSGLKPLNQHALGLWRTRSMAQLLVTQAFKVAPQLVGDKHELLVAIPYRAYALEVLEDWQDSISLRKNLLECTLEADGIAGLRTHLGGTDATFGPFVSQAAESAVFAHTCLTLGQKSGQELLVELANYLPHFSRHAAGLWGTDCTSTEAVPWGELVRLAQAAKTLLSSAPTAQWKNPAEAVNWYTSVGWQVEQAGEEILRNLEKTTPDLLALITPLRAAYRARWEKYLAEWSEIWVAADCPLPAVATTGEWLKGVLTDKRPTAIIISDAMSYALGEGLSQKVNDLERAERAKVYPARTGFPTITDIGMAVALPISSEDLEADIVGGKWQVRQKGHSANLSIKDLRRDWWRTQGKVADNGLVEMRNILDGDIPSGGKHARLVIFDDLIDKHGHDEELSITGSGAILDRYTRVIQRLRDNQWLRVVIVTDHGFIHWSGNDDKSIPAPLPDAKYSSRRAMAYPASTKLTGPQGLAPGGKWRVAFTYGVTSFRTYGGLGYFHGGASLQEWVVPCLQIEWPPKAAPVKVEIVAQAKILSLNVRVTLKTVRESLFGDDALPREVEVKIRNKQDKTVLFSSKPVTILPSQETEEVELKSEVEAEAERGTPLLIQLQDTRTKQIIHEQNSILMIDMNGW